MPNVGGFSRKGLALAAGHSRGYEFEDLSGMVRDHRRDPPCDGPVIIVAKSKPLFPDWSAPRRRLRSSPQMAREAIARTQQASPIHRTLGNLARAALTSLWSAVQSSQLSDSPRAT